MTKSMTAFVREEVQHQLGRLSWEIRSVNHRYLELSFKLPERFRALEPTLREVASRYLSRGKVDALFVFQPTSEANDEFVLNEGLLQQLTKAYEQMKKTMTSVTLNFTDVLRWPGMIKIVEREDEAFHELVLHEFERALTLFSDARVREGEKLQSLLLDRLAQMLVWVEKAEKVLPDLLSAQKEKLLARFEESKIELESDRLAQEMVMLAQRTDVAEELDRLRIHLDEVKRIVTTEEPCGRRLDFLMQELNRESNTLGSKSISEITTNVSIELKVLIEQMREQVQNIE